MRLRELDGSRRSTSDHGGVSRKRFVREAAGVPDPASDDSDGATTAVNVIALEKGARIFRVHNVKMARRALDTAWAIHNAS